MEQTFEKKPAKEAEAKAEAETKATPVAKESKSKKKNNVVKKVDPGPPLSPPPSPKPGKGLSELARQLRVLQSKNETLTVEIGRLERQLRILSETSGTSVSDLRAMLQQACEKEAYGELQHQLASLRSQLQEAKLKQRKAQEFDREADAKQTANLQLRIGELEEAEGVLRREIAGLYKSQDEQAEDATKLKTANDNQADEILRLREQIEMLESQNQKLHEEAESTPSSSQSDQTFPSPAVVVTPDKKKLKDPPAYQSKKHVSSKKAGLKSPPKSTKPKSISSKDLNPADVKATPPSLYTPSTTMTKTEQPEAESKQVPPPADVKVDVKATPSLSYTPSTTAARDADSKHVQLLRNQVASREKELELKESQYKTRFTLQEERIVDMEQQLSSLYTAFELLDQEHSQEQRSRDELTQALQMADSQVAKAVDHLQRRNNPPPADVDTGTSDPSAKVTTPSKVPSTPSTTSLSPTMSPAPVSQKTLAIPSSATMGPKASDDMIVSGYLMKRGRLNRWKKKYASLSRCFANFQLRLSDGPLTEENRKKATVHYLTVFRSSAVAIKEFHHYPYCFRIKIDQYDREAPVLVLAVNTEEEFHQWLVGLQEAVQGSKFAVATNSAGTLPPVRMAAPVTPAGGTPVARREPSDTNLEKALAESLRVSQEESKHGSANRGKGGEESKEEIADSSERDSELEAAMTESLRTSNNVPQVHG